ncbi:MAG: NAD-dependent epimerase/dehydratase family protein, partial [Polyangiaceae bacterium]
AYGQTHDEGRLLVEDVAPSRPLDIYGVTKFAAERIALRLGDLWDLDVTCIRLGSVCGPWEHATGVRDLLSPQVQLAKVALSGESAILPGKETWRDWIYSRDVAAGLAAAVRARRLPHRLYHLSSGIDWSGTLLEWCKLLHGAYPAFSYRAAAAGETPNVSHRVAKDRSPMEISRIKQDLGFTPAFGPREAYADYIDWVRAHEDFIR